MKTQSEQEKYYAALNARRERKNRRRKMLNEWAKCALLALLIALAVSAILFVQACLTDALQKAGFFGTPIARTIYTTNHVTVLDVRKQQEIQSLLIDTNKIEAWFTNYSPYTLEMTR